MEREPMRAKISLKVQLYGSGKPKIIHLWLEKKLTRTEFTQDKNSIKLRIKQNWPQFFTEDSIMKTRTFSLNFGMEARELTTQMMIGTVLPPITQARVIRIWHRLPPETSRQEKNWQRPTQPTCQAKLNGLMIYCLNIEKSNNHRHSQRSLLFLQRDYLIFHIKV